MAKNRKTKKEKLRSAKRQFSSPTTTANTAPAPSSDTSLYSFTAANTAEATAQRSSVSELTIHLREDLLRTMVVTGAIILAEIALYFILLNK